jgi:hypothetical protein
VATLPTCLPPGTEPRYAPMTGAAYLSSRLDPTYKHLA